MLPFKMKFESIVKGLVLLLFCCGLYGSYYSIKLSWQPNDNTVEKGFHIRGDISVAQSITQVMIVTREESLGGTIALMNSVVQNTKNPVYFFIATDNNETMNHLWRWIEETKLRQLSYEIKGLTKEWLLNKANATGAVSQQDDLLQYSRLFFYDIFPNLKRQVIILDDDIIVQGDIKELSKFKMKDHRIGAHSFDCDTISKRFNYQSSRYGNKLFTLKEPLKSLKMNVNSCVFNLGVSIVDVQKWIDNNVTSTVLSLLKKNRRVKIFKEEGILPPLLVALYNRTEVINPIWHVRNLGISSGSRYDETFLSKSKLLQWNGPFKPWHKNSPFSKIWDKYYVQDPVGIFKLPRNI